MKSILIVLSIIILFGCSNSFKNDSAHCQVAQYHFADKTWEPEQRITSDFDMQDTGVYRFKGNFYLKNFISFNRIPLTLVLQMPDGSTRYHETQLIVKENTSFKGEKAWGDIWKISGELLPAVNVSSKGKHILMIYHTLPVSMDGVIEKIEVWCEKLR